MNWLSTTDNEDLLQKIDVLFILVLEGQVYYGEPKERLIMLLLIITLEF